MSRRPQRHVRVRQSPGCRWCPRSPVPIDWAAGVSVCRGSRGQMCTRLQIRNGTLKKLSKSGNFTWPDSIAAFHRNESSPAMPVMGPVGTVGMQRGRRNFQSQGAGSRHEVPQLLAQASLIEFAETHSGQRWERHQHVNYRHKMPRVPGVHSPNVRRAYDEPRPAVHQRASLHSLRLAPRCKEC